MAEKRASMCKGKGSISHNNREFIFKNVNPDLTPNNLTYIKQPIAEAYEQCFGEAVKRFNEKQTRADRLVGGSYFEHIFNQDADSGRAKTVLTSSNKQKSFYEELVQIGTMDDSGVGTSDGRMAAKCLDEYVKDFSKRNPNFYVFNAVMHLDEKTPHLHIDYIPVGHYKRGIDTQNGMAQALKEMGYGGGMDAFKRWRQSERAALVEICNYHGIEIAPPEESRGHSLLPDEYKEQKDAEKQGIENEVIRLGKILDKTQSETLTAIRAQHNIEKEIKSGKEELEGITGHLEDYCEAWEIINTEDTLGKTNKLTGNTTLNVDEMDRVNKQVNGYHIEVANNKILNRKKIELEKREQGYLKKISVMPAMEKEISKLRDENENLKQENKQMKAVITSEPALKQSYINRKKELDTLIQTFPEYAISTWLDMVELLKACDYQPYTPPAEYPEHDIGDSIFALREFAIKNSDKGFEH